MRVENVKGAWTVDDLEYCRKRPLKVSRTASASSSSSTSSHSQPTNKQPKIESEFMPLSKDLSYLEYQQQNRENEQENQIYNSRSNHISKYYEFLNSKQNSDLLDPSRNASQDTKIENQDPIIPHEQHQVGLSSKLPLKLII